MYKVILVGSGFEKELFSSKDGYSALYVSKKERAKTKFAVVLESPSGKRYSMAKQDEMIRRLAIAA